MKRYEGLFILNTTGREEGIKEIIDKISNEITSAGGKIETVQKMDKRAFARTATRNISSGFYVNVIFESQPGTISTLRSRFSLSDEVHRVLINIAPAVPLPAPGALAPAK